MADEAFEELDRLVDDGVEQPMRSAASGSPESLISWETIGRRGKSFIVGGPTRDDLHAVLGREAVAPIRVYAGMRSGDTPAARAELALAELKRAGAFERSILIVATPTGTGWLDPGAVDTVEYLHAGDTAIVAIQYSYLPSWLTLLVDPDLSIVAARALFQAVYGYWSTLPEAKRPKLYLHGLSLGALGSERSTQLIFVLDDMIHGAVWSGPPFPSTVWQAVTRSRNKGSPAWLPEYSTGSVIRFTGRDNALARPNRDWGPLRIVYIQHASDPMSFFAPGILFRAPDWLTAGRGPDVSPALTWYPIVTFLQLAFDLPMATSVPKGYGHNISPASYIHAWVEVTDPPDWTVADSVRLIDALAE